MEFKFTKRSTPLFKITRYKTGTILDTILERHLQKFFSDKNQNWWFQKPKKIKLQKLCKEFSKNSEENSTCMLSWSVFMKKTKQLWCLILAFKLLLKHGVRERLIHNQQLVMQSEESSDSLELSNNSNKDYQLVRPSTLKLSITVNSNNASILQFTQLNTSKFLRKISLLMEWASWRTLNFLFKLTKQEISNFTETIWVRS